MDRTRSMIFAGIATLLCAGTANAAYVGGNSYQSFSSDSAFAGLAFSGYFHLENFEDHLLNTPGVSADTGGVTSLGFSGPIIDSVDEDDGALDGQCNNGPAGSFGDCDSYFAGSGSTGITFTFNQGVLGALPTHVGIVWTDGVDAIALEAFDASSVSLGIFGPFNVAGAGHDDQDVVEDTFVGVTDPGGISSIKITSGAGGGIEVDHLQYGANVSASVPEPTTVFLLGLGLAGLGFTRRQLQ